MARMQLEGVSIQYVCAGESGSHVLLLHGWGQNIAMMQPLADHLQKKHRVWTLDFPGFGESSEPVTAWDVEDYARILYAFVQKLDIEQPILIGHSFGCRVAIHYAAVHPVEKMILTGAAGLLPKRNMSYYVRTYTFKAGKQLCKLPFLKKYEESWRKQFGSADYRNTSGIMRSTFVKVVNDDVSEFLPTLSIPVLLVFGSKDEATPLWMGQAMEKAIPNAGLAIFEGAGHYAYLEQLPRFLSVCDVFL